MPLQTINQFAIIPVAGDLDIQGHVSNALTCEVGSGQATALVAGQPVKLATTAGGVPKVVALDANLTQAFGFVIRTVKDQSFPAFSRVEIAQFGCTMWMTASAAITRGASVEVDYSTFKVKTSAGTNPVIGYALDTATADGDLVRVVIQAPYAATQTGLTNRSQIVKVTATLAEINAGKTLIAGVASSAITVTRFIARVSGGFATGTAVLLQSTNGTPVVVGTLAEAGLTNGAVLTDASASNVTLGAGFGQPLGSGDGLEVANSGSAQTGGTSIDFTIEFVQQ